ncbi:MAG TPA: hypothetical protein VF469_29065 [Kofleriaceae bacterium]
MDPEAVPADQIVQQGARLAKAMARYRAATLDLGIKQRSTE